MEELHIVDARTEEHFRAMSMIHARAWHDSYRGAVPDEYLAKIGDDHWLEVFRDNYESQNGIRGLLLYRRNVPVACLNYCRARKDNFNTDGGEFPNAGYEDWGELASFYTLPGEQGKGYGSILMEEALKRLKADGFEKVFVFVLRENEGARRFYARHGFSWDGTFAEIRFPPDGLCIDLRYTRKL